MSTRMPRTMVSASDNAVPASTASRGTACHSICHSPAARSWPASCNRASEDASAPAAAAAPRTISDEIGLAFFGIVEDAPR
ncbi:hypothetical protein ACH4YO_07245 [Streptomyces noursei]|uniref:hypothetical protein n=1 Tax=Streptomyces noursei TaxID=1971 RepID=UPI00340A9D1C